MERLGALGDSVGGLGGLTGAWTGPLNEALANPNSVDLQQMMQDRNFDPCSCAFYHDAIIDIK